VKVHRSYRSHHCRTIVVLFVVALLVGTVVAPSVASAGSDEISTKVKVKGQTLKYSDAIGTNNDPAIGRTAPKLVGQGFDGQKVVVANTGTPRVVVFLAHWCPHCQREVPELVELAEAGALDGVEVQTVTTNTNEQAPNYPPSEWLEGEDWPFEPVLTDDAKLRAFAALGGQSFPYFVLIGADGKVVGRAEGEVSKAVVTRSIERLLAGEPIFD
jgi:thiol-disulfide isomerase/thioredoxin